MMEAALREHAATAHAGFRSFRSTAIILGASAALLAAVLQPALSEALQLEASHAATILGGFMGVALIAALAHARWGFHSRVYQALNTVESVWSIWGCLVLIFVSGPAGHFFWGVYLALSVQTGTFGHNVRLNRVLFIAGPIGLAAAFALRGDWTSVQLTALAALLAFVAWGTTWNTTYRMVEGLVAMRALERKERDLAVLRDRERIARDLHDGLGAVLTGLLYRVQEHGSQPEPDRDSIAHRLRESIEELRNVVWVLREESQSLDDLVVWLQTRCADLCMGEVELVFHAPSGDQRLHGTVRMHLVRIVLEAVRNAVTHGRARWVEVTLWVGDDVRVVVKDDGTGFGEDAMRRSTGGLANLRARSADLGGTLSIASSESGTELCFQCPASPSLFMRAET